MLNIVDPVALGIKPVILPPSSSGAKGGCSSGGRCDAFRPDPQLSGNLQVDPDILLSSPGMDVDIAMYYNSGTIPGSPFITGPYGYCRTMSPCANAQMQSSTNIIIERGNGAIATYTSSGGV